MTLRDVEAMVTSLDQQIELLTEAIFDILRSASSASEEQRRALLVEEKRLSKVRRSLEKARSLLVEEPQ